MSDRIISIIVPVYNCQKYLPSCIESLVNQTIRNYEIIFVNDASTDNSLELLLDYQKKYPDIIKVIDSKVNMRQGGARNLGIRTSKAKYIGFVDADDFVNPEMYRKLVEVAERYDLDAVYCRHQMIQENSEYNYNKSSNESVENTMLKVVTITDRQREKLTLSSEYGQVWSGCYKRSLIIENELFFPEHLAYEDNYWVYLSYFSVNKVGFISDKLYYYRQQNESTMHKMNAPHHYDKTIVGERLINTLKRKGLLKKHYDLIEFVFLEVFFYNSYFMIVRYFDQPSFEQLKKLKNMMKRDFPDWKKNLYYRSRFSIKKKTVMMLLMNLHPRIAVKMIRALSSKG